MFDPTFFSVLVWSWIALAAVVFVVLFVITAPYGRHGREGWGPAISARLAWVLMESPTLIVFNVVYATADAPITTPAWVLWGLWHLHYLNRTFVYPLRLSPRARPMPLAVVSMGALFQTGNSLIQAGWIIHVSVTTMGGYPESWLTAAPFLIGTALFLAGFVANLHADAQLRRLGRDAKGNYQLPQGGLFRWVSSPNYLAETVAWTGWAIASWSLAGASFAIWTAANLIPRAVANHRWYRENFETLPTSRRAFIPYLW
jgi:3-oxo-5-alpha-steroid 4-dehydrogenase 1